MPSDHRGLAAEAVRYAYDAEPVLRDVSLKIRPGELMALAGPNGSGKTSLLKLLSGVRRPDRGRVSLDGTSLTALTPRHIARRIAVVSQHVDPKLTFTVQGLVGMGRTPYTGLLGPPDASDRESVESALVATSTAELAHRRFNELSGGEQQRVVLAMALAQEASYLLLDEPTVHLDLQHQHEMLELLCRLNLERGIAVLAVMHDLNLAALYFQRLALMRAGSLIADGPSGDVLGRPDLLAVFRAPLSVITHPQARVPQVLLERNER